MNNRQPNRYIEQLIALFVCGPTWDGDLLSKEDARALVKDGYAFKYDGYVFISKPGVQLLEMGGWLEQAKSKKRAKKPC